jgi:hypothetical protein
MMIFSLLSPLAISGKNVTQPNNNYEMGFGEFCTNVIYYKGQLFLAILSFGLLGQAKTYLGSSGFAGCIAAILFCIFALHLYNLSYDPQKDTNLSPNPSKLHGGGHQKSNKNKRTSKNKKQERQEKQE